MKRVALFGGNGYLGSQLAAYMAARGVAYDVFDVPSFDVTHVACWASFRPNDYSSILFFAGMTGTERSFTDAERFLAVNEYGLIQLLTQLAPLGGGAPKVIFPSSRLVYKGSDRPLTEDAPKESKTVYAANKLAGEYLLEAYHVRYGTPYAVARICVPYGNIVSANYSYGTIGFFLKQAAAGGPITLYGDGSLRRTFTHAVDICSAVDGLARTDANGIFNVGGENMSLLDAARILADRKGVDVSFVPWPPEALALESGNTVFDSSCLERVIGWRATKSFRDFTEGV